MVKQSLLHKPPGLILAGGQSRRMGSDKALLAFGGTTLLGHITARLRPQVTSLALNGPPELDSGLPRLPDSLAGHLGPLAGILAGLEARLDPDATHVLTVPVDSPFFPADLAARLADALDGDDAIAVAASEGRDHPVFGLWPVALANDLRRFVLDDERRSIRGFLDRHNARIVEFAELPSGLDPFFNVNTPADFARAQQFLERGMA